MAWRQLRFQTGTYTSGLVNTRVHTLQGLECLSHLCSFMIAIDSPSQNCLPSPYANDTNSANVMK
jgi:hypothetical protein